jgi:hypothetical protein
MGEIGEKEVEDVEEVKERRRTFLELGGTRHPPTRGVLYVRE